MKSRAMLAASVANSDRFLGLSLESQMLYVWLLFEADITGRILGIHRIIRGLEFDEACLDELRGAGFLILVDGEWFDRYAWVNNKFATRVAQRATEDEAIASGLLAFEGAEFRSPYARAAPECDEAAPECDEAASEQGVMQCNAPAPANAPAPSFSIPRFPKDAKEGKEGTDTHPCQCPRCKSTGATFTLDGEGSTIFCPTCGEFRNERPAKPSRLRDWRIA